jgi:hypothetical protein
MPDLWLKEGHVVGMDLPLGEVIESRWRNGDLQRVNEDGSPWSDGDEFAILARDDPAGPSPAAADPAATITSDVQAPARPPGNAPRRAWAAYAVALGACTEDVASTLTRAELIDAVTAPEDKPGSVGIVPVVA